MLRDIGITRADALAEAEKVFWRAERSTRRASDEQPSRARVPGACAGARPQPRGIDHELLRAAMTRGKKLQAAAVGSALRSADRDLRPRASRAFIRYGAHGIAKRAPERACASLAAARRLTLARRLIFARTS